MYNKITTIEPTIDTTTQHIFLDIIKKDTYMFRLLKLSIIRPYIKQSKKAVYKLKVCKSVTSVL